MEVIEDVDSAAGSQPGSQPSSPQRTSPKSSERSFESGCDSRPAISEHREAVSGSGPHSAPGSPRGVDLSGLNSQPYPSYPSDPLSTPGCKPSIPTSPAICVHIGCRPLSGVPPFLFPDTSRPSQFLHSIATASDCARRISAIRSAQSAYSAFHPCRAAAHRLARARARYHSSHSDSDRPQSTVSWCGPVVRSGTAAELPPAESAKHRVGSEVQRTRHHAESHPRQLETSGRPL
jgi:hypothetical protein